MVKPGFYTVKTWLGAEGGKMLPQIENLYFYSVNLYFYMVKKEIVWGNYDFFTWSKRVFTRSKISVLLGQMDFYMVSKNENNNSDRI